MIVSRVTLDFAQSGWAGQSKASVRTAFERIARSENPGSTPNEDAVPSLGHLLYYALIEGVVGA